MLNKTITLALLVTALVAGAFGQSTVGLSQESFGQGVYYSPSYNYQKYVSSGGGTTGAYSINLFNGSVTLTDGRRVPVFSTSASITIGQGSAQETVTPSSVSAGCSVINGGVNNPCTITATFANAHGKGDLVVSGTAGLQEAINDAGKNGGGMVFFRNDSVILAPTSGTTTDSAANMLPANAWITYVGGFVSTAITGGTCSSWALGDASTAARFVAADSTLTAAEAKANSGTGFTTGIASATTGMVQGSAAKVRLTCGTGAAAAGAVSVHVQGYVQAAPAS
jgi:hypothetical protein